MRAILVGDVHLADHAPSIRLPSYLDEILAKLEFAVEKANELEVDAFVQAGDLIHVKAPGRTSHALVQRCIDVLNECKMPVLIVPGNHDMSNDRIESLPKQPLGTVCKAPNITMLMGPAPHGLPIFGIPYLWDFPTLLPQWMKKYNEWLDANPKFMPLVVTHAPIFPDGESPIYDFIAAEDWAKHQKHGACYYGHIHDPHGAFTSNGIRFCNQGALSRGSLHEATLKRKPGITLFSDVPNEQGEYFERIDVPHKPASEVFRLQEKEDVDVRQERVSQFLDGVEQTVLDTLSVEEVVHHAEKMSLKPRTLETIRDCIEEVSSRG